MAFDPSRLSGKNLLSLRDAIEKSVCEDSLYDFLRKAWPAFDPAPFMGGWALHAIAEHLQACNRGEIKRLLINIRPRASKTSLCSIAWPVWTWAQKMDPNNPLVGPGVRFLCASYGANKAQEDAVTARRLIGSEWFQRLWGSHVRISKDRDNAERYDTLAGGSRISTGIPESLGKGGMIRICFPSDEMVATEYGPRSIGDIVRQRQRIRVWSTNPATGETSLKHIEGWHKNPGSRIVEVVLSDGSSVRCTPMHEFWTRRGWVAAADLRTSDMIPCKPAPDVPHGPGGNSVGEADGFAASSRDVDSSNLVFCNAGIRGVAPRVSIGAAQVTSGDFPPGLPRSNSNYHRLTDIEFSCDVFGAQGAPRYFDGLIVRQFRLGFVLPNWMRSVLASVIDVLDPRPPCKIVQCDISGVSIQMSGIGAFWARADERFQQQDVDPKRLDAVGKRDVEMRIAVSIGWRFQDTLRDWLRRWQSNRAVLLQPPLPYRDTGVTLDPSEGADAVMAVAAADRTPLFVRDVGYAHETFCLTVSDFHTFYVGSHQYLLSKNCDDPHKTTEVESETTREQVIRNYREIWQTRANDPLIGAEVIVMQRLAEMDLSGYWLENFPDAVHLCLPAWYESDRHCTTYVNGVEFWSDPREEEGESFWLERFPPSQRARDEQELTPYALAGQIQQRPEPRGGGIIKRMWWQAWPPDEAIEQWMVDGQASYPPWELQVAYLDTAFTKKETNDYCAMTRWGVFANPAGTPCAMLCGAWEERHNFNELIEHVKASVRAWKTDILIIENKAGGIWVRDELIRELSAGEVTIVLDNPVVDKEARAHAIVPMFTGGLVYAPFIHDKGVWRAWAEKTISECEKFPTGRFKDLVDTVTGALGYLRRNDLIKLKQEAEDDEREAKRFKGNSETVAESYGVA